MGIGYFILFIISLIFIAYTSTLIGLYATDTITFNPNTSNWVWLSLGVAGMFGCFGVYMVIKSMFAGSSKSTLEQEIVENSVERTNYGSISQLTTQQSTTQQSTTQQSTTQQSVKSNYGKPPNKTRENKVATEYGQIQFPPEAQYDKVDDKLFEKQSNSNMKDNLIENVLKTLPNLSNPESFSSSKEQHSQYTRLKPSK